MPDKEEEIKTALQKYLEAVEEVKKLIHYGDIDSEEYNYKDEEIEALRTVLKEETEAKKTYFTLVFERLKWSEKEINEWMEKNI